MHLKLRFEEDLQKVVVVPSGVEAFVFDSELLGVVVLEQAQRGAAEQAEVAGGVAFAEAGLVFLKGHVELPMQFVFEAPMATYRGRKEACGELLAENVVTHLNGPFPIADRFVERDAIDLSFSQRSRSGRSRGTSQTQYIRVSSRPCPRS